ncbi:ATP-binding protein [Clostridiales bacterium COT073_COT-073]|nr:ATP-binding protein [Clostridiales bacterium COT073_COT-073]
MGILTTIRNKVTEGINKATGAAADGVAALSKLSPSQVKEIDEKRRKYLSERPSASESNTFRNLEAVGIEIFNVYFSQISNLYLPIEEDDFFKENDRITYFEICKWVKDPSEDNIEKLMNIYHVLSAEKCNVALVYHRKMDGCFVYLAVVNNGDESDINEVRSYKERIKGALKGNFPGTEIVDDDKWENVPKCLQYQNNSEEGDETCKTVALVSNLATEKSEKYKSQTIEKLLDGIVPTTPAEEYVLVLLVTPVKEIVERKNRLFELYNALLPYANWQTNYTVTEIEGDSSSASAGFNLGLNIGSQSGATASTSTGITDSDTSSLTEAISGQAGFGKYGIGGSVSKAASKAKSVAQTAGRAVSNLCNFGINTGTNFARTSSVTVSLGKNEGITQNHVNYGVKHMLELLEKQLFRLEQSAALGLWDFAAYVISEDSVVVNNVAHTYLALSQGEESFLAQSAVNVWRGDLPKERDSKREKEKAMSILKSVSRLQHPEFCLNVTENSDAYRERLVYPSWVTATTSLSGKELARALNFPSKSINGLPVVETAAFGRSISSYNEIKRELVLGKAYHMHKEEKNSKVGLSKENLTSHVFVTGSTGTGKTNTVIGMIQKLCLQKNELPSPKFMVIEPAKGEYKNVLGGYECVKVYGTNPQYTMLLRLNPFSFPKNISVSEHIDRLVEIFNVCWPMYAAMPAILKDAVIKAYEAAGWDICFSQNRYSDRVFPSFVDVMEQVKVILTSSEYSNETRGDYTGALISRLNSLTNGINGQIFSNNALSDKELFDENVIVDLSRVGSIETKSLIMGILLLKLQEYRLSEKEPNIEKLEHIMVLEEAHNLLRRTSLEQVAESSNLLGKSVEMLTNAIAELRAFGESFIIVDQAPELLDKAVIRNTNTKIVHRMPEQVDREIVGKAMALKEDQIMELAKLELGIAAVYQSDWIEAVLCKVDKVEKNNDKRKNIVDTNQYFINAREDLLDWLMTGEIWHKENQVDLLKLKDIVLTSNLSARIKCSFLEYLQTDKKNAFERLGHFAYEFFEVEKAVKEAREIDNITLWVRTLVDRLTPSVKNYSGEQIDLLLAHIINEQSLRNREYTNIFLRFTEVYKQEGRVF